ncbi:MAG TPA: hypothetical protein VFJ52_10635 [Terriglobia bacterium]|nr:hypothetical protein [Terriglobia bacterium]
MADRYNEEGVSGFSLPGMTAGADNPQGDYGTFSGGMGPVGTSEGRLGGGGWVDNPMAFSAKKGYGIWAESPAADDEMNVAAVRADQEGSDLILKTTMGWDSQYMEPRWFVGARGE